jgi:exodeoxyribonuclease VII small subunit
MAKTRKDEAEAAGETGFEQSLERLEEIVERMEQGDLALEEAMSLFEEGVKLGQACQKRLDEAERKITLLLERADGTLQEQTFDADAAARIESAAEPRPARRAPAPKAAPAPAPARQPSFGDAARDPDDIPF